MVVGVQLAVRDRGRLPSVGQNWLPQGLATRVYRPLDGGRDCYSTPQPPALPNRRLDPLMLMCTFRWYQEGPAVFTLSLSLSVCVCVAPGALGGASSPIYACQT